MTSSIKINKVGAENSITGAKIQPNHQVEKEPYKDIINRLITRYCVPIVGVRNGPGYLSQ